MANLVYGGANSTGPKGDQIGWVDFGAVPSLSIGQSYELVSSMPGGGSVKFTLTNRGPITATALGGAGKVGSVYTNLGGNLSLGAQKDSENTVTIEVSNIEISYGGGVLSTNYTIYTADPETTIEGETWEMQTDGGVWIYEGISPSGSTMGDPAISGLNTNLYKQTGNGSGGTSPIISSKAPRNLVFRSTNKAHQFFTLGIYMPGSITVVKEVDKSYAKREEDLTYKIILKNTTFMKAENVVLIDTIPENTVYIQDSLTINGIVKVGNMINPISLPNLEANSIITILFKVKINNTTTFDRIKNSGIINYSVGTSKGTLNTNEVNTFVYEPKVSIEKMEDKVKGALGDTVTYTLILKNTGTTLVNNLVIFDTIPNGTTFIDNSVTVDSVTKPNINIGTIPGLSIPSMNAKETKTVTFQVKIESIPTGNIILNDANLKYTYVNNPSVGRVNGELQSNLVTLPVIYVDIKTSKSVDKAYARRGDTVTYTITIPNVGNMEGEGMTFIDTIPKNTTFIQNSLTINNVQSSANLETPITLPNLKPGEIATVIFKVKLNNNTSFYEIDNTAYINLVSADSILNLKTNTVKTFIYDPEMTIVKAKDVVVTEPGKTITYSVLVKNTGTTIVNSVYVYDTIPEGTIFVKGSIKINGVQRPTENIGVKPGVLLMDMEPNTTQTVTFQLEVVSVPKSTNIENDVLLSYRYVNNPQIGVEKDEKLSNIVTVPVRFVKLIIRKNVDKKYVARGEEILYQIIIENKGNVRADKIIFNDTIPQGTAYVNNSLTVNGVERVGIPTNFNVGTIEGYGITTITFKVITL